MEIDFLITGYNRILPMEVKFSEKIASSDGRNMERFLKEKGGVAKMGIVVYPGRVFHEIRKNI